MFILAFRKLGLFWVRIGFVFRESEGVIIFIILCYKRTYVHLSVRQIGFVLHKKG